MKAKQTTNISGETTKKQPKNSVSEAEALVLLQQVTMETNRRLRKTSKENRKVVGLVILAVVVCVVALVAVLMMKSNS